MGSLEQNSFFQKRLVVSFVVAVAFHVCLYILMVFWKSSLPPKQIDVKKICVSTIRLQPHMVSPLVAVHTEKKIESPMVEEPKPVQQVEVQEEIQQIKEEEPCEQSSEPSQSLPQKQVVPLPKKSSNEKKQPSRNVVKKTIVSNKGVSKKQKGPSADSTVDPAVLQKILKNLDQSKAIAGSSSKNSSGKGTGVAVSKIGTLSVDKGAVLESTEDGVGYEESSEEGRYIVDLIRRLKLHVRLREPTQVRLILVLRRDGTVQHVSFVQCKSEEVRRSLHDALFSLRFAPFGHSFGSEKDHSFHLRLTSDLHWSCAS